MRQKEKVCMTRGKTFVTSVALSLTTLVVAGGCTAPQDPAAAHDHAPPQVAPDRGALGAGELVSVEPVTLRSYPGDRAWRITYRSTTTTGTPDIVSGAVIAPTKAAATTPIIGYAPGTLGLGDQCAQSRNLDLSYDPGPSEKEFIQRYTSAGYAVAIADYQGLGTPGGYPYDVGRSEGHALLDVLRAAGNLRESHLSPAAPVAMVGYSQGGLATGWAAQLAPTYAPELRLKGAAVGAPPADLNTNVRFLDGTAYAGLVLATVYGLDVAYPDLHLERYLNAKGRAAFKDLADDCVAALDGSKWQNHKLSEYTTEDVLARPDWQARLAAESLGSGTPTVPVLLYNSKADEIVPYETTAKLGETWRANGADVTLYAPNTGGHGTTAFAMMTVTNGWIDARFLNLPTTEG